MKTMKITMLSALALVPLFSGCERKSEMPRALSPEAETLRLSIDEQMAFIADTNFPVKVERPEASGAQLRLVVVRGFGKTPMFLLTTLALEDTRDAVWEVVQGYLTRWR